MKKYSFFHEKRDTIYTIAEIVPKDRKQILFMLMRRR